MELLEGSWGPFWPVSHSNPLRVTSTFLGPVPWFWNGVRGAGPIKVRFTGSNLPIQWLAEPVPGFRQTT